MRWCDGRGGRHEAHADASDRPRVVESFSLSVERIRVLRWYTDIIDLGNDATRSAVESGRSTASGRQPQLHGRTGGHTVGASSDPAL